MIERHIDLDVLPEKSAAFERFFAEQYLPPVLEMPGIIECLLLRELDRDDRYQMVFRWETVEHAAAWRTSDAHEALQPALNALREGLEVRAFIQVG